MAFLNFDGYKKSLAIRIASNYKFKARKEKTQPANMVVAKTNSYVPKSLSFVLCISNIVGQPPPDIHQKNGIWFSYLSYITI